MKLATLIATAVLGTSSLAAAKPLSFSFSGSAGITVSSDPIVIRDHRGIYADFRVRLPAPQPTWFNLGTLPAGDHALGREVLEGKRIDRLLLQAHGWVYLEKVRINFADGTYQIQEMNRWVSGNTVVDVTGHDRLLKNVIVKSMPFRNAGSVTVYARNLLDTRPNPAPIYGWNSLGIVSSGSQTFELDRTRFTKLALVSNGTMTVESIVFRFADKRPVLIKLDRTLTARSAPLVLDAPEMRGMTRITVNSKAAPGVDLMLYGR